jgi:hypothetical protein
LTAGSFIGLGTDQGLGHIACPFEDAAWDFPSRLFRTASGLQRARRTIELAGAIKDLLVIDDCAARGQRLDTDRLRDKLRITIGTPEENVAVVAALRQIIGQRGTE